MLNKKSITTLSITAGIAFIASLAMASAANATEGANPFAINEASSSYIQLAENKCGGSMKDSKDMKEGKCGSSMKESNTTEEATSTDTKTMKEGKCGGDKTMTEEKKEGKCGQGKCGGSM